MQWWESLAARIDALTLRERAFIMAGLLAVTYFAWTGFHVQPMERQRLQMKTRQEQLSAEIAGLNATAQALLAQARTDPNEVFRSELESLKLQLAQLNNELAGTTDHLVPPQQMARMLQAVLQGIQDLRLERVLSLGSSPLVPEVQAAATAARGKAVGPPGPESSGKVYKHGVRLTLQGSYFGVLDFMRKLETLEWKFFWDSVEFRIVDYPDAVVEITLYTISLEPVWIGA